MSKTGLSLGKKILLAGAAIIVVLLLAGLYFPLGHYNYSKVSGNSGISAHPQAAKYNFDNIKSLPRYDPNSDKGWQVDVRSRDLTGLNLSNRLNDLMYADFDSLTKWPSLLPEGFNPEAIMKNNQNPGFNLRQIHQKGITGKGISIAIIDQELLTDHQEYQDRLKLYERIHSIEGDASMHGAAVSSIAVGTNVGVAPEANLYYISTTPVKYTAAGIFGKYNYEFSYLAKAIDRILEINKTLPQDKKIRAISISVGWTPHQGGFKEVDKAVKRAQIEGVLVVSTVMSRYYDVDLLGLGKKPLSNPDDLGSYQPGLYWEKNYYSDYDGYVKKIGKTLMVPMDSRSTASPTGINEYVFYRTGGLSWSVPYLAGLYVLCCQVQPDITPEQFLSVAIASGDVKTFEKNGRTYKLGTIINPVRLMDRLGNKIQ